MSTEQVLPTALIALGNRCQLHLENMGWNFKVDHDGDIVGLKMMPADDKKVPVTLSISERGPVMVFPHRGRSYSRECEATKDEVRGIRRELPCACDETTQDLVEKAQDAGFGSRVPYCSTFQLDNDDLIIDSPIIPYSKEDCFIKIKPDGTATRSCLRSPVTKDVVPVVRYIMSFDPRAVAKVKAIISKPTEK
ncbi:MAG: hypothetical protein HN337_07850 [Deltaproteobacteria bacterium]|jgi:hypothetical protein|nr:hypothetical protein [Deltaproteobacteria bacterium]